jgi:hypothetical protein
MGDPTSSKATADIAHGIISPPQRRDTFRGGGGGEKKKIKKKIKLEIFNYFLEMKILPLIFFFNI